MNTAEHLFCSSSLWRWFTQRQLLPWVLSRHRLGDHLLELGAGYGAATPILRQRVVRVTSLEYDHRSTVKLSSHHNGGPGGAVRGDASRLPFPDQTFSSVLAILVLHHLKSREAQDQMFVEAFRVLRPGGLFLTFEITDGWFNRVIHFGSTFTPVPASSASSRLAAAGFSHIAIDHRPGAYRLSALRPELAELPLKSLCDK